MIIALALASTLEPGICGPAADIRYTESAPADFVILRNLSPEGWEITGLSWALEGSDGGLIFDTVAGGNGVGSSAAFLTLDGTVRLTDIPLIADGGRDLTLSFGAFPAGEMFRFSIDLDDTGPGPGGTTIQNSELAGARIEARFRFVTGSEVTLTGAFEGDGMARLRSACTS